MAHTTEQSVHGGDATSRRINLSTCLFNQFLATLFVPENRDFGVFIATTTVGEHAQCFCSVTWTFLGQTSR